MSHRQFDWEEFFSKTSFNEIRRLSPDLASRRPPSTFSPDGDLLYLSSRDAHVEIANQDQLREALIAVKHSYIIATRPNHFHHAQAYIARLDFTELCKLLACCSDDPDEYSDPDSLLGLLT